MEECLTVSQVNSLAKDVLEQYSVWIKGEVSNVSADKYFYKYFSLKDESSSISCVFPASKLSNLDFVIEDGITLKIFGKLSIFERDGRYQLKAEIIQKDGAGDLQAKIEEIKVRLQKEGLLDESRKRKLPGIPQRIAVITSKDGAAWKDFLKILTERYPNIEILLYDILVQGDKAPGDAIRALRHINGLDGIDLIVITRGGGSLEDLMAFNDESLAREIANSKYPVVSAIGHEKDVTIADLVADLRASTPSNAAELIVPQKETIFQGLDSISSIMEKWLRHVTQLYILNLQNITSKSLIEDESKFILRYNEILNNLTSKITSNKRIYEGFNYALSELQYKLGLYANNILKQKKDYLTQNFDELKRLSQAISKDSMRDIENLELRMKLNNPLQILEKGYSIVTDSKGKVIKSIKKLSVGEILNTRLSDGLVKSNILELQNNERK